MTPAFEELKKQVHEVADEIFQIGHDFFFDPDWADQDAILLALFERAHDIGYAEGESSAHAEIEMMRDAAE